MNNAERLSDMGKLIDICHANLKNSDECLNYLKNNRGLSDATIGRFKLGYFPQSIRQLKNLSLRQNYKIQ